MTKPIALITGSSQGIGASIASSLAKDGFDVILHYKKHRTEAESVSRQISRFGHKVYLVNGDISDSTSLKRLFVQIKKITHRLDCLVNNAGFDYGYLLEDYTLEQIKLVLDTNLFGTIAVTKLAIPLLKKSNYPCIVNISSRMGGPTTIPTISAYGPSKAGINKFTQACAIELAKYKIRVNSVSPSMTDTLLARNTYPGSVFKTSAQTNPRNRICRPEDIANTVSFLVSARADFINGTDILVTGGSHLY